MFSVRASRWLQSRLTPSPLRFHRLTSKRLLKRLPLKPFSRSLGLAAALVAATGLAPVASAQPTAVAAERGDLALVPYYTVRGEWVTGIHLVNTSDSTQVVKFRLRRATDGMNALDFNVVMSPRDVYAGFLSDDQNGAIAWTSPDSSCTVPATQGNRLTMPPIYRVGAESGYVEIIAMGQAETEQQPIAVAARHSAVTSTPLDCAAVRSNFFADGRARVVNRAGAITVAGSRGVVANNQTHQPGVTSATNPTVRSGGNNRYVDSGNVLKVSYFIRDNATGIEFGDNAVHIADFLGLPSITNQEYGIGSGDLNGFDFPDLDGTGLPNGAAARSIVRNRFNLLRRTNVLGVDSMINEWSANPANGVEMDWVVTLPGQYLMLRLPQYLKSLGTDHAWFPTVGSAGSALENPRCPRRPIAATAAGAAVDACDFRDQPLELEYIAYNREEFKGEADAGTLMVSPQTPAASATTYLPKVANVITFGGKSVLGQSGANVTAALGQPFGWLEARLRERSGNTPRVCAWNSAQDGVSAPGRPLSATAGRQLRMDCGAAATGKVPVIGFAAWSRQVAANLDASYGRIVEHSYRVLAPGAPTGLTAMPGNGQVAVSWTAVNSARSYTVYYSRSPTSDLTASSVRSVSVTGGTSVTVTGLPNGTLHYFRVTATNAGGEGAASNEASATPQVPVPGAPTGLSLTAGNGQVAVSWMAVSSATGYTVYYSRSPVSDLTALSVRSVSVTGGTSVTVTGLPNGTLHYFRVTATNAGGEGAPSNEASATPQVPGTITAGTVFRDTLSDGGQGPQMVVLPTGSFQMGSPNTEIDSENDERPVRTVNISKRIAMGRYEVTFADYDRFANATGRTKPGDSGWGRGSRPVINVSQEDAQDYATWLSTQTGKTYRLPSEAEWEYAARAGTRTRYSWGDEIGPSRANCDGCGSAWDDTQTAPVGSFAANAFGLFDMHGNVWEWVEDCYVNTYNGAPTDGSARTTGCGATTRAVVRGGSWFALPQYLRSAYRVSLEPSIRFNDNGFRLVQDLNP